MKNDNTSIIFAGDIGFDRYMDGRWEDENLLSESLLDFFHSADHVCINVEGAVIDVGEASSKGAFFHAMNPNAIGFFEKIGADIWSIGNNHIMDAGTEGLISTRNYAEKTNVFAIGAGINNIEASEPIYIKEAGGIGMICTSYMNEPVPATESESGFFRWDDMELIRKRIVEIKSSCRWCIVVVHGGEEFSAMPNPYTRERYKKYIEMGADVVVGHHPHVPENYELFDDGKAIFYSLGNFVFDTDYQRAHLYTDMGVLLKLTFTDDEMKFEAVGTKISREDEHIDFSPLPDIFANIPEEEYRLLSPLAARAFMAEEKRRMVYLEPERFKEDKAWDEYIHGVETDGYVKGAHMDLDVIDSYIKSSDNEAWKESKLEKVKKYILSLL